MTYLFPIRIGHCKHTNKGVKESPIRVEAVRGKDETGSFIWSMHSKDMKKCVVPKSNKTDKSFHNIKHLPIKSGLWEHSDPITANTLPLAWGLPLVADFWLGISFLLLNSSALLQNWISGNASLRTILCHMFRMPTLIADNILQLRAISDQMWPSTLEAS